MDGLLLSEFQLNRSTPKILLRCRISFVSVDSSNKAKNTLEMIVLHQGAIPY